MLEKHAEKFKQLVDKNGIKELARWECEAGITSEKELFEVFNYLERTGWSKIKEVKKMDEAILNPPKETVTEKPKRITFSVALNRRISNAFDLSEIRKLGIKHMTPEEALALVEKREYERRIGK